MRSTVEEGIFVCLLRSGTAGLCECPLRPPVANTKRAGFGAGTVSSLFGSQSSIAFLPRTNASCALAASFRFSSAFSFSFSFFSSSSVSTHLKRRPIPRRLSARRFKSSAVGFSSPALLDCCCFFTKLSRSAMEVLPTFATISSRFFNHLLRSVERKIAFCALTSGSKGFT